MTESRVLPANWRLAKRYPVVVDGRVRMVPYALARRVVRFSGWCVTGHDDGSVQAERGSWLCWRCRDDLQRALLGIERSWPALQDLLHPTKSGGQVGSKSVDPAVPVELAIVDVTTKIELAVSGLASQLLEDRPDLRLARGRNTGTIAGAIGRWHLTWITSHPSSSLVADGLPEVWDAWLAIPRDAGQLAWVPPINRWIDRAKERCGQS
ncbi:hypothetical protein [Sinomonas sp. ASV322]|uniref:hypothetical protein n=1 Tax=Sinomonas sp. ASV322 TaxID=3041920 RepID=UPI0027DE4108|nr:hypothetical protein [Sinomonas sp. ASV322]MDQ4502169.1 hypothetical protein [Sinomonas sp. ASV322]